MPPTRRLFRVAALAATVLMTSATLAAGVGPTAATAAPQAKKTPLWSDSDFTDRALWSDQANGQPKSQAPMRVENTFVRNGDLVIRTVRHCVSKGEALTNGNIKTKPCKKNLKTRYSTGRVARAGVGAAQAGNFKMSIRATLPANAVKGTRQALWLKNGDKKTFTVKNKKGKEATYGDATYCTGVPKSLRPTKLGEIDILEWYGKKPKKTTATTHVSCHSKSNPATFQSHHTRALPSRTKTWTVIKKGNTVTYRVGSKVVGKDTCGKGKLKISKKRCADILKRGWELRLQGEVFKAKYGGPSNAKNFPIQELVIHSVKVWKL